MASYGTTRRHHQHAVLPQLGQLVLGLSLAVDTSEVANSRDHALLCPLPRPRLTGLVHAPATTPHTRLATPPHGHCYHRRRSHLTDARTTPRSV